MALVYWTILRTHLGRALAVPVLLSLPFLDELRSLAFGLVTNSWGNGGDRLGAI